jgi:hypothetical protein
MAWEACKDVHKQDKDLANPCKARGMLEITAEMRSIVHAAAEPWQPGEHVKAAILRASRKLGIGYRRTRSFWYAQPVRVRADEADRLRAVELRLLAERQRRLARELQVIRARLDGHHETTRGPPAGAAAAVACRETVVACRETVGGGGAAVALRLGPEAAE